MIAVIQRVRQASVTVENQVIARINQGLVILLGVAQGDTGQDVAFIVEKITRLRIFPDTQGKMTASLQDINGELLLISQFTLLANTEKGRRPSFELAAPPEEARERYQDALEQFQSLGLSVQTGIFGATMVVSLENDGPVTLILDSRVRKGVNKVKNLLPQADRHT
ncbi:MAG TPA: D-aminoacyl-tRNA deacylase [Nitrospirales bacterium]|nr:D-tyrosyl-tRNA(Tyr) deacylase [Nitrospiraceae bacterium]HNP30057.1 D-aminoacyl-tRNA deacylase [Nitrospirales bacterium]